MLKSKIIQKSGHKLGKKMIKKWRKRLVHEHLQKHCFTQKVNNTSSTLTLCSTFSANVKTNHLSSSASIYEANWNMNNIVTYVQQGPLSIRFGLENLQQHQI